MAAPGPLGKGVAYVMLGVKDAKRASAFYQDTLGLMLKFEMPGWAFIDGGGVTLCLAELLGKRGAPSGCVEVVFGVDDVRAAHAALKDRGVAFSQEPRQVTPNEWAANFTDPDGHLLSIFGPEKA